eukprot:GHVP01053059.1.p1 GENE.GHVP01053059.1~~GHVP01053059.1.p1  ORF type:complete len:152 (+),score=8.55 GHVP01053059.1:209-664(+)
MTGCIVSLDLSCTLFTSFMKPSRSSSLPILLQPSAPLFNYSENSLRFLSLYQSILKNEAAVRSLITSTLVGRDPFLEVFQEHSSDHLLYVESILFRDIKSHTSRSVHLCSFYAFSRLCIHTSRLLFLYPLKIYLWTPLVLRTARYHIEFSF